MINKDKDLLAAKLFEYIDGIEVVDTHEHLPIEADRLKEKVDFSKLFSCYTTTDLMSAGMTGEQIAKFNAQDYDLEEKWRIFEPCYKKIKNGSYARAARISMEKFYGLNDLKSLEDALIVTQRIQQANQPGLYKKVLKDTCKLGTVINFDAIGAVREFLTPVLHVNHLCEVSTQAGLFNIASKSGQTPTNLKAYVDMIAKYLKKYKEQGVKGFKFHTAYNRDLKFENVTHSDAEKVFNRIHDESIGIHNNVLGFEGGQQVYYQQECQGFRSNVIGFEESRPLQDYLTHRIVEMAGELDVPIIFHTGAHDGRNNMENSRPLVLWNLFNRYCRTRFVLLHAGIPWVEEAGIMAKYFDNVYLDMAWMHIISPELSVRAPKTWIDMIPRNKIFGFGGDYTVVEKVYGHLHIAKENIARALASKIEDGSITEEDAYIWAKSILHDNPNDFYRLGN